MSLEGRTIGKIRILEQLGKGGMGEVYLGLDETLERKVAVKAIRGEQRLDTEAKARFKQEAKILSQLEHPNICRIYDFIETDEADFLIMEYVRGRDLEKIHATLKLTEKLDIAEQVAEVLSVAHERNIVHRDLKPDNVMLTEKGFVKVLDFGLARGFEEQDHRKRPKELESQKSPEDEEATTGLGKTHEVVKPILSDDAGYHTAQGAIMGTPLYMSPEQARSGSVTGASDMYSFGLLLQWLFTGAAPYPGKLTGTGLLIKAMRGDTLPVEGVDPDLTKLINRLKSVSPENRPTAPDTADRIRWVQDKPKRRFKKLAASAFVLLLLVGTTLSSLGFFRATQERRRARESEAHAKQEADNARQTVRFLQDFLSSVDPGEKGKDLRVMDLMEAFKPELEEMGDRPLIQASLFYTYSKTYMNLGLLDEAVDFGQTALELREKYLPDDHPDLAGILAHMGWVLEITADYDTARQYQEKALAIYRESRGEWHPDTAQAYDDLGSIMVTNDDLDAARPLLEKALAIRTKTLGPEHRDTALSHVWVGQLEEELGNLEAARKHFENALAVRKKLFGLDHPETAQSLSDMSSLLKSEGDLDGAMRYGEQAMNIQLRVLGEHHPVTAQNFSHMASLLKAKGDLEGARTYYLRALAISQELVGDDHPFTATTLNSLGSIFKKMGDLDRAKQHYEKALPIRIKIMGERHPSTQQSRYALARVLEQQGETDAALAHFKRAAELGCKKSVKALAKLTGKDKS